MNEFIRLPQAKIFSPMPSPELIFVTGGRAPSVEWLLDCASSIAGIWSIDHGIDVCHRAKLAPQLLIGDLDSARSESIAWAKSLDIPIEVHPVDKDFTDTQLALDRAAQLKNPISVVITGAFGGRVDHLFATLFTCAHSPVRTILADEREVICFIRSDQNSAGAKTVRALVIADDRSLSGRFDRRRALETQPRGVASIIPERRQQSRRNA